MAPLVSRIKSILMMDDSTTSVVAGDVPNVNASSVTQTSVTSTDLSSGAAGFYIGQWLEAVDGNCKGQFVKIIAYVTNTATITPLRLSSGITTTTFKMWKISGPYGRVQAAGAGDGSTCISNTLAGFGDDYWNGEYLFAYRLGSGFVMDLKPISDYVSSSGTFTLSPVLKAASISGDIVYPCQTLQPKGDLSIAIGGGDPLERDVVQDTLDAEGVIVGAMTNVAATVSLEVRGMATAAGNSVAATPPKESHIWLDGVFAETLSTGDLVKAGSTATSVILETSTARFAAYDLMMINGSVGAITAAASNTPAGDATYTIVSGHLPLNPISGQTAYAGACYKPLDSGHKTQSLIAIDDDARWSWLHCGLPTVGLSIEGNQICRWNLAYKFAAAMHFDDVREFDDIYDTAAPMVGKGNVSRVVLDGVALDADVLSANFDLLTEPVFPGSAFGALENRGPPRYTKRMPTGTLQLYLEDNAHLHRYRAQATFDLLVQVGTAATQTFAIWIPRAQLVASPGQGEADEFMSQTLSIRALRPTTQTQPSFVIGIF